MKRSISEWKKESSSPVFIVFEAGATHDGLETAKKLVDVAVGAGADAIKFQMLDVNKLIPDPSVMFTYNVLKNKKTGEMEEVQESLNTILKRREMPKEKWSELIAYCKEKDIEFFSTASNAEEMDFLFHAGCSCVKIASGDITYHRLMQIAAQYPWTVQIDTGSATIAEVEEAVAVLEAAHAKNIIINHCPVGYPAHLENVNLRVISTLKQLFPSYPIAFSDHTPGNTMDACAVSLGVNILEKTITLDRQIRSPEHIMSLEPQEAAEFVSSIRGIETALGSPRCRVSQAIRKSADIARRSIVLAKNLPTAHILTQEDIDYVRPSGGLIPYMDKYLLGKKLRRDISAGTRLTMQDVE